MGGGGGGGQGNPGELPVMRKCLIICAVLYTISLAILIPIALSRPLANDRSTEYSEFLDRIDAGTWKSVPDSLVNSSIMATLIPAWIAKYTGIRPDIVFNLFPCLFQALIPVFVFLISRRYLKDGHAVLAGLFLMSQYNFLYNSNLGRVAIAWGIFAIFAWAFISRRYLIMVITALLMVFSHYGTSMIAFFVICFCVIGLIIQNRLNWREWIKPFVSAVSVCIFIAIWYFVLAESAGFYISKFVENTIYQVVNSVNLNAADNVTAAANSLPDYSIFAITNKEYVVQLAFGQHWGDMTAYMKVEWFICWAIILTLLAGIFYAIKKGVLKDIHLYFALGMLIMIGAAILVPYASMKYGVVRVYFQSLIVIAPFFIAVLNALSEKLRWNSYILPGILIAANAFIVSGSRPLYLFGLIG